MPEHVKSVATNRKAGFEYYLFERFEAGLALKGSEIKSIRAGQISLAEAYVRVDDTRGAFLMEAHIAPYVQANRFNHDPKRARRLLLPSAFDRDSRRIVVLRSAQAPLQEAARALTIGRVVWKRPAALIAHAHVLHVVAKGP